MRKSIVIAGAVCGFIALVLIALFIYAAANLNGLIKANRDYLLAKASDALGRKVEAREIRAALGWGVMMELDGVTIADDPAFTPPGRAPSPFVRASQVYCKVDFLPLLAKHLRVTQFKLENPEVHLIRARDGKLNVSTIGKHAAAATPQVGAQRAPGPKASAGSAAISGSTTEVAPSPKSSSSGGPGALAALSVNRMAIVNGTISYLDEARGGSPIVIRSVDLNVDNFSASRPFSMDLKLAAFGDQQNLEVRGKVGPLMHGDRLDFAIAPLALTARVGPLLLASIRSLPGLAGAIPAKLEISKPVNVRAVISGSADAPGFDLSLTLTPNRINYAGMFDKPEGTVLKLEAKGSRKAGTLKISQANLELADAKLKASDITIGSPSALSATVDSNRFDVGPVAKMLPSLARYSPAGRLEAHLRIVPGKDRGASGSALPNATGTIALAGFSITPPGASAAALSDLNALVRLAGNKVTLEPSTFDLASGHAKLQAEARSIQPLDATYRFSTDILKPGDLVPSRKSAGDVLRDVTLDGAATGTLRAPQATAHLVSTGGKLNNIAYNNLDLTAKWAGAAASGGTLDASFKVNALSGSLDANGRLIADARPRFNGNFKCTGLNLEQALQSQGSKVAGMLRGTLTAQAQIAGSGSTFAQIKPTLDGKGQLKVVDGKLVGINVAADALNKVKNIPGINVLVPASVVARHPELFRNPDTDIQAASLSFVMKGPRITSHDITLTTTDYSMLGDGWFDLDRNLDLAAHIVLSKPFSTELEAANKNVKYLTNSSGEVDIPLQVAGALPKPRVTPDLAQLAQRAGSRVVEQKAKKFLGGLLGKKSEGVRGPGTKSSPTPGPSGPLAPLRGLLR